MAVSTSTRGYYEAVWGVCASPHAPRLPATTGRGDRGGPSRYDASREKLARTPLSHAPGAKGAVSRIIRA